MAAEDDLIDALDEYFAFKRREARGIDGPYFEYVYGHAEVNDTWRNDRRVIATELVEALRGIFDPEPKAKGV